MRICLYTGTALPKLGGQEAVVDALARTFLQLGHEPFVIAPQPRRPLKTNDSALPYPVIRHPRFFSTKSFVSWYQGFLVRASRRHHFDVLHCHDVYPTGYLAAITKSRCQVPIVLTSHGGDVRAGNVRLSKPGMMPRFVKSVKAADALISIGRFTDEGFLRLGADPSRIHHIPNGVDMEPFAKTALQPVGLDPAIVPGKFVLFIGRLALRKGVDTLLNAVRDIPDGDTVQLVIAGSGEEAARIDTQIETLSLQNRVRRVGRVSGDLKTFLLQSARCVVMPSRDWEAFPLVILESYAAGTPVVGFAIPGLEDLIKNNETGLLVDPLLPGGLTSALRRVFEDDAWLAKARASAKAASVGYDWTSIAMKHLDLYHKIANQ